jgi:hypothetical protein
MAASSCVTLLNAPRRMRSAVIRPKKRSTWLSQDAEVGVKHLEPLVSREPGPDAGLLVCGVVVGDQVHIKVLWCRGLDASQEPEPFLMAMSLHTLADHSAGGDIECCEQRRCPVAFVVVRHSAASAFLDRQAGLRTVQRLDLAFFVVCRRKQASSRVDHCDFIPTSPA